MRWITVAVLAFALSGCDSLGGKVAATAVDPSALPPLTSREQSLIFAADGAFQQGNYAQAERDYLGAVAESKGRVEAHLALAGLYEKQQQSTREKEILERALQWQPNHALANYLLGRLYLNSNDYASALHAFQQGRVSRPDDADLGIGEAVAQDMTGNHDAAQQIYLRILKTNPGASREVVHTDLAMSYILSGMPEKAIELLQSEAAKPGASNVTRHNLALAYGLVGRHADAKSLLHGDIDEDTRMLTLARMKAYHQGRSAGSGTPVPEVTQVEMPPEASPSTKPAPVVMHPPVVEHRAAPAAQEKEDAAEEEPSAGEEVPYDAASDPNYVPGLEEEGRE